MNIFKLSLPAPSILFLSIAAAFSSPALAEPTGFTPTATSFLSKCASGEDLCFGSFAPGDEIFTINLFECTSIGYAGGLPGRSCLAGFSRPAHSTDPYALVLAYYNAALAVFKSGDESAQGLKPLPIEQCSDIPRLPPGSWPARPARSIQCYMPYLGRDQRDDHGGTVAVWTTTPVTIQHFGMVGDPASGALTALPCEKYASGFGCPTPVADRTPSPPSMCEAGDASGDSEVIPASLADPSVGDPIGIASGAVSETRSDLSWPISFSRSYSSANSRSHALGSWSHNHESSAHITRVQPAGESPYAGAVSFRMEDGSHLFFTRVSASASFASTTPDGRGHKAEPPSGGIDAGIKLTLPSGEVRLYDGLGRMALRTARSGYSLAYAYNYTSQLVSITDSYGRGLSLEYAGNGFRLSRVSTVGGSTANHVNYAYSDSGNLAKADFNGAEAEHYAYTSEGRLSSIADAEQRVQAMFAYDSSTGKAIQSKRPLGADAFAEQTDIVHGQDSVTVTQANATIVYQVSRDPSNMRAVVNGASVSDSGTGYSTSYSVARSGIANGYSMGDATVSHALDSATLLPQSTTEPRGNIHYTWDPATRLPTRIVEPSPKGSRTTDLAYDSSGNLLSKTVSTTASGTRTWSWTYGSLGKVMTATTPDGATTAYEYYPDNDSGSFVRRGMLRSASNALGHVVSIAEYDEFGNPSRIIEADGVATDMAYDERGRLLSKTRNGVSTSYAYDSAGMAVSLAGSNGYSVSMSYDDLHRLSSISDSNGDSAVFSYDAMGNRIQDSASQNSEIASVANRAFDSLGRLRSSWGSNSMENTSVSYDANGRVASSIDALGRHSSFTYAPQGGATGYSVPGEASSLGRDMNGNLTAYYLPSGFAATTYAWNDFDEPLSATGPDWGSRTYARNVAARTSTMTDAGGVAHTISYDAAGRVASATHALGANSVSEVATYDAVKVNRPASIADASGSTSWTWNDNGQPLSRIQSTSGASLALHYAYDANGQVEAITYPSGMVVAYSWTGGRVSGVSVGGQALVANIGYRPFSSEASSWTWGSGGMRSKTFDADGRITGVVDSGVLSQATEFDAIGRLSTLSDSASGLSLAAGYSTADGLASFQAGGQSQSFTLDANFNRTGKTNFDGSAESWSLPYGANNLPQQWTVSGSPHVLTYDSRKNMTNNGRSTLAYNLRGRLGSSSTAGTSATYAYNFEGYRVKKTVAGAATLFAYDDSGNLIGEYAANGAPIMEHIYLGSLPIGAKAAGALHAVHTDYLDTPRVLTSGSTVSWRWDQTDPFGANAPSVQAVVYNHRFPGQYYDHETGLHDNRARTYDPKLGRYLQPDPLGLEAGRNPFNYANHNPLNASDPDGRECQTVLRSNVKMTRCTFPGVATFEIPAQKGFPAKLHPSDANYHGYHFTNPIGGADRAKVIQGLIDVPTPGGRPKAATRNGTRNQADVLCQPIHDFTNWHNNVTSFVANNLLTGGVVVVNVTGDGYSDDGGFFKSGYVAKTLIGDTVHTVGEGNSALQSSQYKEIQSLLDWATGKVWAPLVENVIKKAGK